MGNISEGKEFKANKNIQNYADHPNFKLKHVIYFPLYFWYLTEKKSTDYGK